MKKVVNALQKARFEIETKGLYKGMLEGPKGVAGPCCIMGAICRAVGTRQSYQLNTLWSAAVETLEAVLPDNNIPRFNDAPTTKKKDVLKSFDYAISLALSNEV